MGRSVAVLRTFDEKGNDPSGPRWEETGYGSREFRGVELPEYDENSLLQRVLSRATSGSGKLLRETIEAFATNDPSDFVLRIVASAVENGASYLLVDSSELDLSFEFDGKPFRGQDFFELMGGGRLFDVDLPMRKLMLASQAALQSGAEYITVEFTTPGTAGSGSKVTLTNLNVPQSAPVRTSSLQRTSSVVRLQLVERKKLRILGNWVTRMQGQQELPEIVTIRKRCAWAGLDLIVDKSKINKTVDFGRAPYMLRLRPQKEIPSLDFATDPYFRGQTQERIVAEPIYAAYCLGPGYPEMKGAHLICGGCNHKLPVDLPFRNLSIVATCFSLESDLKHEQALQNAVSEKLSAVLQRELLSWADEIFQKLMGPQSSLNQSDNAMEVHIAFLQDYGNHCIKEGKQERAGAALCRTLELQKVWKGPGHPELLDTLQALERLFHQGFDWPSRDADLDLQCDLLMAQSQAQRAKNRIQDAANSWLKALEIREARGDVERHPEDLARQYHDLAMLLKDARLPGSEGLLLKSVNMGAKKQENTVTPAQLDSFKELAERYRTAKNFLEAEKFARQAVEGGEQLWGSHDKQLLPYLKQLAEVLKAAGQYANATDIESRALSIRFGKK